MPTARVTISQPGQRTRRVSLDGPVTPVGRRPDNVVCLESDTNVSKYHAVIESRDGEFWVTDLGSSNGTTVNGEPLYSRRKLLDGDLVCLGGTSTLEFHLPDEQSQHPQQQPSAPPDKTAASPPVRLPTTPSMNLPTTPSVHLPTTPSSLAHQLPSPTAAVHRAVGFPRAALYGLIGVGSLGALLAVLWSAGVIGGARAAKNAVSGRAATRAEAKSGGSAGAGAAGGAAAVDAGPAASQSANTPAPSAPPAEEASAPPSPSQGTEAGDEVTGNLARTLAVQISQKSFYKFDPGFVALINSYVNEYRAAGYYERAGKYRAPIDREFVNVQGIQPPLIAYVTAMSQTKFVEGAGGVWKLPPSVVSAYAADGEGVDMRDPAASTRVAAAYVRSLLDLFERDNFMYAVACYGMTLDQAGQVRLALESTDPGGRDRYDFWKMKNAGVVRGEQVERVARFFAAGIVGENPRQFGLKEEPLSSLY